MLLSHRGGQPSSTACSKAVLLSPSGNATWLAEVLGRRSHSTAAPAMNEQPSIVLLLSGPQVELRLMLLLLSWQGLIAHGVIRGSSYETVESLCLRHWAFPPPVGGCTQSDLDSGLILMTLLNNHNKLENRGCHRQWLQKSCHALEWDFCFLSDKKRKEK